MPVREHPHIPESVVRKFKKSHCERCKISNEDAIKRDKNALGLHHRDMDRTNNTEENLMTLCTRCHTKEHWLRGSKRGYKKQHKCSACVELGINPPGEAVKLGLCETHRTRMRRSGSPFLYRQKVGKKWMMFDERVQRKRAAQRAAKKVES